MVNTTSSVKKYMYTRKALNMMLWEREVHLITAVSVVPNLVNLHRAMEPSTTKHGVQLGLGSIYKYELPLLPLVLRLQWLPCMRMGISPSPGVWQAPTFQHSSNIKEFPATPHPHPTNSSLVFIQDCSFRGYVGLFLLSECLWKQKKPHHFWHQYTW